MVMSIMAQAGSRDEQQIQPASHTLCPTLNVRERLPPSRAGLTDPVRLGSHRSVLSFHLRSIDRSNCMMKSTLRFSGIMLVRTSQSVVAGRDSFAAISELKPGSKMLGFGKFFVGIILLYAGLDC